MLAKDILKSKGSDTVTIGIESTLDDAITVLAEKNIGAVLVLDSAGSIAGILSERDIMRVLKGAPVGFRSSPVSEAMTHDVATCGSDSSILEILQLMTSGRFRHVPIVDEGKLAGIISIGDAVKARIAEVEHEAAALKDYISA